MMGAGDQRLTRNIRTASTRLVVVVGAALVAASCATTTVEKPKATTGSNFLGKDYALLTPGETSKGQAGLRYFNPSAQWRQYTKVIIDPVTFWGDDASKVAPTDQQALATYFNGSLTKAFSEKFEIVTAPGPGVMKLQVAVVDAEAATPDRRARRISIRRSPNTYNVLNRDHSRIHERILRSNKVELA